MSGLWELFKQELRAIFLLLIILVVGVAVWHSLFIFQLEIWRIEFTFILNLIPLVIYFCLMFYLGWKSFQREWENNTIYSLLLLPKFTGELLGVKLLFNFAIYFLFSLASLLLIYYFYEGIMLEGVALLPLDFELREVLVRGYLAYIVLGLKVYILTQFAYLFTKLFAEFRIFIGLSTFIISSYLVIWGGEILAPLFTWLPELLFSNSSSLYWQWISQDLARLTATLGLISVFFIGSSLLLRNLLEI
ncbi:hypothetical protein [Fuchsiella alkaliacetigena]|uniref:hypothetical protein n=1 Tax=Fuchsiella alkaliacetigena TaxID=957042 RepID=UPI00200A550C|nr:hypothetical protein [Fuchsiella alkaliacetigena]MCK8825417.1 hypothetical protein [Fuchsiella alkaliacetigena]